MSVAGLPSFSSSPTSIYLPDHPSKPIMDPSCAQGISDLVHSKFEWRQEKLVFSFRSDGNKPVEFDTVLYLGRQVLKTPSLSFRNPIMDQKDLIALLKQQALKQGLHLTTVASTSNSQSSKGCFFKLACNRFRAHKDAPLQQATPPSPQQVYNPNLKIGSLRATRITRGLIGKKLQRRKETMKSTTKSHCCPFNFTFKLRQDIDSWVLIAGTGSCVHKFHPEVRW
jgi:hypothetical protein